jgi:hypothetical protein
MADVASMLSGVACKVSAADLRNLALKMTYFFAARLRIQTCWVAPCRR